MSSILTKTEIVPVDDPILFSVQLKKAVNVVAIARKNLTRNMLISNGGKIVISNGGKIVIKYSLLQRDSVSINIETVQELVNITSLLMNGAAPALVLVSGLIPAICDRIEIGQICCTSTNTLICALLTIKMMK